MLSSRRSSCRSLRPLPRKDRWQHQAASHCGHRILLPSLRSVVKDLMSLQAKQTDEDEDGFELAVVDFVDAYQTIGVHPDEQRHQVTAGFDGSFYVMRSAAALLGRSRQAMFCPSEALKGSPLLRSRYLTVLSLWWLALGRELSWSKVQREAKVCWIGDHASVHHLAGQVNQKIVGQHRRNHGGQRLVGRCHVHCRVATP